MQLKGDIRWTTDAPSKARLVALNYSGGVQSTAILEMYLAGAITTDLPVYVLNADPGMENSGTYTHVARMRDKCDAAGVYFETVEGPSLYKDLLTLKKRGALRIDNPAYFTKDEKGKRGMLRQKCTYFYKIAPMDRALRRIMHRDFGIGLKSTRIPKGFVEKWIGFASDEVSRCKPPAQRYVTFYYPLIAAGMDKQASQEYLKGQGLEIPPRSVCNACFANGLGTLKEMHDSRPDDWAQAVAVDESVRDWSQIGIKNPVYVNDTLIPLSELARRKFDVKGVVKDGDDHSCDSGYCFI